MKALSLTQPWAWLVIHGGKDVENRLWNTKLRGRFLVHAAKGMKASDYESARHWAERVEGYQFAHDMPQPEQLERGGIIGSVELIDVIMPTPASGSVWHFHDQFGFRLRDPRPTKFIPWRGALGFWNVPDALVAQLEGAA